MSEIKYYVLEATGTGLLTFVGEHTAPEGYIEVPYPPQDASQVWSGSSWQAARTQVPQRVTMRQARLALHRAGLLANVEAAINTLPEPPRTEVRIEWDYSQEVHRNKEFVITLGGILGLTSGQLDELFIEAAGIQ